MAGSPSFRAFCVQSHDMLYKTSRDIFYTLALDTKIAKGRATRGTAEVVQRPRLFSLNSQCELVALLRSLHA
jgi:hypothetical protein